MTWNSEWGRPTVVVDWDGTCVTNTWPEQSEQWLPGARDALHTLSRHARVVIMSSRTAPYEPDEVTLRDNRHVHAEYTYIRYMLDQAGLFDVEVHDFRKKAYKPGAVAYVDDKGLHYGGQDGDWERIVNAVLPMCVTPV